jgi:Protein of unknown function, DUF488
MRRTRSPPPAIAELYTVGHSNHAIEHFLALLRRHRVETVADVRSRPYSRFVPHFGKERLARFLEAQRLGYLFLGQDHRRQAAQRRGECTCFDLPGPGGAAEVSPGGRSPAAGSRGSRVALLCRERDRWIVIGST